MWLRRSLQGTLIALAIVSLLGMAMELVHLPQRPVLGMSERNTLVTLVRRDGPAWKAGLRDGDRIVEIAGQRTEQLADPSLFLRARGMEPTRLIIERQGRRLYADLAPAPPSGSEIAWQISLAVTAATTLLIGAWVLRQRMSEVTIVFFGICFTISALSFHPYVPATAWGPPLANWVVSAFSLSLPGILLHFFLLFPFERRAIHDNRWILALVYFPAAMLVPISTGIAFSWIPLGIDASALGTFSEVAAVAYWILALILSLALFVRSFRSSPLPVVRAKLRVTLAGTLIGLLPLLLVVVVRALWPHLHLPGDRLAHLTLVLLPATFGYAILRHGIFETETLVQRGLIYSALTSAFVLLYFLAFFGLRAALRGTSGFEGHIGTTLALGFALLVMSPVRSRLQDRIDRWVYPDRFYIRRPLRETALRLQEARGREIVMQTILDTLDSVLRLECAVLFRAEADGLVSRASIGLEEGSEPLRLSHHLADPLLAPGRPLSRAELEDGLPYGYLPASDLAILRRTDARVFLPLVSPRGRFGVVALGPRAFGERYSGPDFELLEGLQAQAVLALENALLEEEHKGHVTLTEELDVARSIQRELLPREIPRVPKLDLAATNTSCSAVGGDYYDCALLPDGTLALAVADVTGHGVPAALLMANIQAIFRAEIHADRGPAQILHTLNARLCAIDRPERFATFVTGRWQPETNRLRYANGGHHAPILVRGSGEIERLDEGGPVLGILPQADYSEGETQLGPGDVLVLFTDGVVEQGGPDGRFQEKELLAFLQAHRHLSPRDLLGRIQERIDPSFDETFADDVTLMVLKRL